MLLEDDLDLALSQLLNARLENLNSTPAFSASAIGRIWYDTVVKKIRFQNDTQAVDVPSVSDLSNYVKYISAYNGSTNLPNLILIPPAIGGMYDVSVAGTLNTGSPITIQVGDVIIYKGGNSALASSWIVVQANDILATIFNSGNVFLAQQSDADACAEATKAITSSLLPTPYNSKTASYTATTSDFFIDCTNNTFTITAYTAVGNTRRELLIKNSGNGLITVNTIAGQLLDDVLTITLPQGAWIRLKSDGANWKILDLSSYRATQISSVTVSNSIVETSLIGTLVNTNVIPANLLKVGTSIRLKGNGIASRTLGNLTINVKLDSITICTTGASAVGNGTNLAFSFDVIITCRSIGVLGSVFSQGQYLNSATNQVISMANTAPATIDTTTPKTIGITATWSGLAVANSITLTNLTIEVLK